MTPDLIFFGIKSLISLGRQGERALIEYAADQPLEFPDVRKIRLADPQDAIDRILALPRYAHLTASDSFRDLWTPAEGGHLINQKWVRLSPEAQAEKLALVIDAARADSAALALVNDEPEAGRPGDPDTLTGLVVVAQWKPGQEPVSPLGRMALAIVAVALDYVAADPGGLRAGTSGEKVIKSFALALGGPLGQKLDAATLGPSSQFVDGLLGAFVGAGLETLKAHAGELVSEPHLAKLVENVLAPVIDEMKNVDATTDVRMQRLLDVLAGPVATAAIRTVAENPDAFLGNRFDSSKAAGAIVGSILVAAAKDDNVRVTFSEQGLLKLLSASLQVVVEKPGLFIRTGEGKDKAAALVVDLAQTLAGTLKGGVDALAGDRTIDGRALGAGIAAAVVESIGRHVDAIGLATGEPWRDVGVKIAKNVLAGLVEAIRSPGHGAAFKQVLSEAKLVELAGIVVEAIAANPRLAGVENARAGEVIGAVAETIGRFAKEKKQFVLDPDGWLELARLMTKELVARAPALTAGADPRLQFVVAALGSIVEKDRASILAGPDIIEIARALLTGLAAHPQLLGGLNEDIRNVAVAVAQAMAADDNLLLSAADWVAIVKAAAAEAAANPGRLFGTAHNTGASLAGDMTGLVVGSITAIIRKNPAVSGLIVKGELVRDATIAILAAVSGAPDRATAARALLEAAVTETSEFVAENAGRYGGRDWLRLIQVLVEAIVREKIDAASIGRLIPAPQDADALLAGGA